MKVTQGINWLITCTDNFDETVAFFRDIMGMVITETGVPVVDTQFTRYALFKMADGAALEIVEPRPEVRQLYRAPIACLTVDDLAQARLDMASQQVELVAPIFADKAGWGWTYFRAPDGNVYQIQGPYRGG